MLDNFPFSREQFTLMIERGLVPDHFICLKDDSENGSYLAKRWEEFHKDERSLPEIVEEEPAEGQEGKESIDTAKKETKNSGRYQTLRTLFENNWQQLAAIVKGTNNLEPMMIPCDKDIDSVTEEAIKAIEGIVISTSILFYEYRKHFPCFHRPYRNVII